LARPDCLSAPIVAKQLSETRFLAGAFSAAKMGILHVNGMATAERLHLYTPVEAKNTGADGTLQNEIRTSVGRQYIGHRTIRAVPRPPGWRPRIALNQTTFLL
jgi:hypothetical protein